MKRDGVYDASRVHFRGSNLLSCIVAVLCDGDYQSQVNSIEKWSAASEVCVEDVLCHLGSIVEGWVNMSYKIRIFCQRLI